MHGAFLLCRPIIRQLRILTLLKEPPRQLIVPHADYISPVSLAP